jgi:hypothetical protein
VRAAGAAPIYPGDPGFQPKFDRDKDGIGCEQYETKPTPTPPPDLVHYKNCDAVRAAGAAPIYRGEPGFQSKFDRDKDGIGCEVDESPPNPTPPPTPRPPKPPKPTPPPTPAPYYPCDADRAAGKAPIYRGDPGYSKKFDRDGDGIGCE